jgi:hypothetical protein
METGTEAGIGTEGRAAAETELKRKLGLWLVLEANVEVAIRQD